MWDFHTQAMIPPEGERVLAGVLLVGGPSTSGAGCTSDLGRPDVQPAPFAQDERMRGRDRGGMVNAYDSLSSMGRAGVQRGPFA